MKAKTPTRIIWITSDHMRYDHIAANGNPAMITPALDSLVKHGVNFHECFTQNPLCMPSRCSFMTGLYPQQTGVTMNGHCLPADFKPTVATAFKAAGYYTAQIGKLHFQPHDQMDFDVTPRNTYGFDVFWPSEERGNYSDGYYHWLEGKYPQYAADLRVPRSSDPDRHFSEKVPSPKDVPWQATHAGWIVDVASQYLTSRMHTRQFMHLGFYNPHPPLTPCREAYDAYEGREFPPPMQYGEEWNDKPEWLAKRLRSKGWTAEDYQGYRKGLAAMVTEMDYAIGWLMDWLREREMLDDTLIIFSSDHGDFAGDHYLTHKGEPCYDSVMRVPLVMHWPNGLKKSEGGNVNGLMEMVDLLPTLLDLAGGHIPDVMVGNTLADALRDGTEPEAREDVMAYHGNGTVMLRNKDFKYLRAERHGETFEVLYDLSDPNFEAVNVAGDPKFLPVLQTMRNRLVTRLIGAARSAQELNHPY